MRLRLSRVVFVVVSMLKLFVNNIYFSYLFYVSCHFNNILGRCTRVFIYEIGTLLTESVTC